MIILQFLLILIIGYLYEKYILIFINELFLIK
jgi:hypothetical protein